MAQTETGSSGSNGFLYFVVGALVVAVAVLGFFYFQGQSSQETAIERSAAQIGEAAEAVGDSAEQVAESTE